MEIKMGIEYLVSKKSDHQLMQAFREIEDWKYKTAILKQDGIFMEIHNEFEELTGEEFNLRLTEDRILFELSKRFTLLYENRPTPDMVTIGISERIDRCVQGKWYYIDGNSMHHVHHTSFAFMLEGKTVHVRLYGVENSTAYQFRFNLDFETVREIWMHDCGEEFSESGYSIDKDFVTTGWIVELASFAYDTLEDSEVNVQFVHKE